VFELSVAFFPVVKSPFKWRDYDPKFKSIQITEILTMMLQRKLSQTTVDALLLRVQNRHGAHATKVGVQLRGANYVHVD